MKLFPPATAVLFAAGLSLASIVVAGGPVSFDSPKGTFHIQVTPGNSGGSDLLPLTAFLTPAAGGKTIQVNFQIAGYVVPDAARMPTLFHFSPDETTLVVDNPNTVSIFGYRIVPLTPRSWLPGDIDADSVEWADNDRLVFRGQTSSAFFIGIFNAKTGKQQKPDPSLSMYTTFEMIHVTPTTITFREEDTVDHGDRCMVYDTVKGKAKAVSCPGN